MRRTLCVATLVLGLGLGLGLASNASASAFQMAPVAFTIGSTSGTISLVGGGQGLGYTVAGNELSGTAGAADDLLTFQVNVSSGSLTEIGVGIFLNLSSASGTIAGPDANMVNGTVVTTGSSLRTFSASPGPLSGLSDPFWVTWASVADGATIDFMLNNGSTLQTFQGTVSLVPEPATLLLAALGLAGIGVAGRARRAP